LKTHSWIHTSFIRSTLSVVCALLLLVPSAWARTKHHPTSKAASTSHASTRRASSTKASSSTRHKGRHTSGRHSKGKKTARGQQGIDGDRTREIQTALIRSKYMDGEPSGVFDQQTKSALMKFQSDNGWQTKVLPDSRALIKLGLGPSNNGLLNPESAAISSAHQLGTEKEVPGGSVAHK
jgi:peptidoglycan hydrolase-like protein with peptidoglycan-binding domain